MTTGIKVPAEAAADRLRPLFERAGARWIELPVLHPADPFLETAGEDIRRRMFVTEGPTGERLALRPDFTIPVCLEHLKSGGGPARYAYGGLAFRRHDQGSPERLETGYEDLGRDDRVAADAEALALAAEGAAAVRPGPLAVRVGDIGLFSALLRALGLPGRWRRRLRHSFGLPAVMARNLDRLSPPREQDDLRLDPELRACTARGDRDGLTALLAERAGAHGFGPGVGRAPAHIAERFLDGLALPDAALAAEAVRVVRAFLELRCELDDAAEGLARFAAEHRVAFGEPLATFAARAAAMAKRLPGLAVRYEGGFGRPLDYYTGLVFEIGAAGLDAPLVGGGRYDRLLELLGAPAPVPAVGFTLRLDAAVPEPRR